jgi:hypothetical protein
LHFSKFIQIYMSFKNLNNLEVRKISRTVAGQPSAHDHKPNGAAAWLALPAIRPSGPVRAAQPQPKWPGHRAQRGARTARGHHSGGYTRGGAVARPTPTEKRPKHGEVFRESIVVRRGNHRTRRRGGGLPETAARRWSGAAQRCSTAVEARGHWRRAPMSPADGEERGG